MRKIPGKERTPKGIAPLRPPPGQLGDIDPTYGLCVCQVWWAGLPLRIDVSKPGWPGRR